MNKLLTFAGSRMCRPVVALTAALVTCAGLSLHTPEALAKGWANNIAPSGQSGANGSTGQSGRNGVCASTARLAFGACGLDVEDNYSIEVAKCLNVTSPDDKRACLDDAKAGRREEKAACSDVRDARLEVCGDLTAGGGAYDPPIDSMEWVPADSIVGNTYLPLIPGTRTTFMNTDGETIVVTVTYDTTEIMGVPVRVVTDVVTKGGRVTENTIDWFAQDSQGNVWYFGEKTQAVVEDSDLVSVDGSWEAGVDGAKPGVVMPAVPNVGDVYRQEWLLGDAEDVAKILGTTASESAPKAGPAVASCSASCVLTHDYSPLEPDASESKFYAPGVGVIVVLDDNNPAFREEMVKQETVYP